MGIVGERFDEIDQRINSVEESLDRLTTDIKQDFAQNKRKTSDLLRSLNSAQAENKRRFNALNRHLSSIDRRLGVIVSTSNQTDQRLQSLEDKLDRIIARLEISQDSAN